MSKSQRRRNKGRPEINREKRRRTEGDEKEASPDANKPEEEGAAGASGSLG